MRKCLAGTDRPLRTTTRSRLGTSAGIVRPGGAGYASPTRRPHPRTVTTDASLTFDRRPGSIPAARAVVRALLEVTGFDPHRLGDLIVAVSEACTNVVEHAGAPRYQVEVHVDAERCEVIVRDDGSGFRSGDIQMPDATASGGRGLALMELLVDEVEIRTSPGYGTEVLLRQHLRVRRSEPSDR